MPRHPIYADVMAALERRIGAGDYMFKDLPGERKLAEEFGISYMTARKAVLKLIDQQVLSRRANGSLIVHPAYQDAAGTCQVSMLTPAYPSPHLLRCRLAATRAAADRDVMFRPAEYVHWDDSIVRMAIDGSDGVLIMPSTEPIPKLLLSSFAAGGSKVVFLDSDATPHGVPSIGLIAPSHVAAIFEHLRALGHQRIDCFNAQGHSDETFHRIGLWRTWLAGSGCRGDLFDEPTPPYGDVVPVAHAAMHRLLDRGIDKLSAIVCTTQPAAEGVIRACADRGVVVGKDVSVCAMMNEPTGRYSCPSITGLEMPDIEPLLARCFDWFASDKQEWVGERLIVPDKPDLFLGESTGPARGA